MRFRREHGAPRGLRGLTVPLPAGRTVRPACAPHINRAESVTTEEDFRAMIDAHPGDHYTLLVFADWLQDRGDPRAEAWRALGVQRVAVCHCDTEPHEQFNFGDYARDNEDRSELPYDWFTECARIVGPDELNEFLSGAWFGKPTAREAYDVVIAAFLQLPPERRAELCEPEAAPCQ